MRKAERPRILLGRTTRSETGCGHLYTIVTRNEGKAFEVFGILGKAGGCTKCLLEGLTRCITLGLRYGIPLEEYVKQLQNLACPLPVWGKEVLSKSCVDAIAQVLAKELEYNGLNYNLEEEDHENGHLSRVTQNHETEDARTNP